MPPEMDFYYWHPVIIQPFLEECDINLVKEALTILLHPNAENSTLTPESIQLAHKLYNYIKECHNAFLASERIRIFLLLSLAASLIISFIALLTLPATALSVTLICLASLILFSVNVFTLINQMGAYQQEIDKDKLKEHCSDYTEKLYSGNFKKNLTQEKIASPTSAPCFFSIKEIPQNDAMNTDTDNDHLNHTEHRLSPINEELIESNETRYCFTK